MELKSIVQDVNSSEGKKITTEAVEQLFSKCILRNEDFDDDGLTCDFMVGDGVSGKAIFSLTRLNQYREQIDQYISQIRDIDSAPQFTEFFYDNENNKWANDGIVVDRLIQLGMASNMLFFTFSSQLWPYLPNGLPYIGKTLYNADKSISGIPSIEYTKYF